MLYPSSIGGVWSPRAESNCRSRGSEPQRQVRWRRLVDGVDGSEPMVIEGRYDPCPDLPRVDHEVVFRVVRDACDQALSGEDEGVLAYLEFGFHSQMRASGSQSMHHVWGAGYASSVFLL